MTDIPDEAVEAAFDRVGMRIKVLPAGSAYTARDLLYSALEAALPLMQSHGPDCELVDPHWLGEAKDKWTADGYDECHDAYEARIKELEEEVDRLEAERKALLKIQEQAARATSESVVFDELLSDPRWRVDRDLHEGSE